eukprot:CAMPEP_0201474900 /NCGR_PEP_ID=MMETSP0151_2-20130828/383_1 /ASSEMBLY_ACC=CAM_ASM_000257 /TAXON_ID=200890 /ORGANISM="Paramoeba atlantica, Strain 621/1 / CCAP 1560/9" /LENGTH=157 /DNA_ID=CAMNT_0047854835 /DNA_START=213 /DNA_END=686 /DNA_ORIENTATION=-
MKRNPRKVKWTKAFRKSAGKEMAVDLTLEMERRRNRPPKYDPELMKTTLAAMKRVQEIKKKRDDDYHSARMKSKKAQQIKEAEIELEKYRNTIPDVVRYKKLKTESKLQEKEEEEDNEAEAIEKTTTMLLAEPESVQKTRKKKKLKEKKEIKKMEID